MMKTKCLIFLFLFLSIRGLTQSRTISGIIYDSYHKPLIGANIYFPINQDGTISDIDGKFILHLNGQKQFVVSYTGFLTDTVKINSSDKYIVHLKSNPNIGPGLLILDEKFAKAYNFSTINKEHINSASVLSQQEIYNSTPGVFMFAGAPNTNKLIIRGIGSRSPFSTSKIRAYINDVPITNGIGESNLEDINLSFIDKIQITKGPSAPEYGSSLGGIIHYKTIPTDDTKIAVSNTANYGSFNTIKNNTQYDYNKKNIHFIINQDLLKSDGYRDNNNYSRVNLSGFGQMIVSDDIFTVFVNRTQLKAEIPSFLSQSDYENNPSKAADNWQQTEGYEDYIRNQVSINHSRKLMEKWNTNITGFISTFENYERRPFNVLTQNNTSVGTRSVITHGNNDNGNHWKIGLEFFHERENLSTYETLVDGAGNILSDNFEKRNFINVFTQGKYTWNRIGLTAGLNFNSTHYSLDDRYTLNGDQSGNYTYNPILSPFISFYYKARKGIALYYFNIAHGFAAPTLEETLTVDGTINTDIKAETGWNMEVGIRKQFSFAEIDASIYTLFANNLLVSTLGFDDSIIRSNAGKSLHPGLEISLSKTYYLNSHYTSYISWRSAYQYAPHIFLNFVDVFDDYSNNFIPGNPKHTFSANLTANIKRFQLQLNNSTVSKMYRDDANENTVDGYSLIHMLVKYNILKSAHWNISLAGQVNNLFNKKHASMFIINPQSFGGNEPRYLYPGLPRNYFIGLQLSYNL